MSREASGAVKSVPSILRQAATVSAEAARVMAVTASGFIASASRQSVKRNSSIAAKGLL